LKDVWGREADRKDGQLMAEIDTTACHACSAPSTIEIPGLARLGQVTSDCTPWPSDAQLRCCARCGLLQKRIDVTWHAETREIYSAYTMYQQSGGAEQRVFDVGSGASKARSDRLLDVASAEVPIPTSGRLLDIGCGNGSFLRAFGARHPGWTLAGTELDERSGPEIRAIPGVEDLFTSPIADIPGDFSLISMIHLLEHIVDPVPFLRQTRGKLRPGGLLLIDLPYHLDNPFDLLIADHASHFSPDSLSRLLETAGFEVLALETQGIPHELVVCARRVAEPRVPATITPEAFTDYQVALATRTAWLGEAAQRAVALTEQHPSGVFGSSIAGTWLFTAAGGAPDFFVDEDPARANRTHLGRPILLPSAVPDGATVLVGLVPSLAQKVASRIARPGVRFEPLASW
jgi:SAM-dependent methyltransferase